MSQNIFELESNPLIKLTHGNTDKAEGSLRTILIDPSKMNPTVELLGSDLVKGFTIEFEGSPLYTGVEIVQDSYKCTLTKEYIDCKNKLNGTEDVCIDLSDPDAKEFIDALHPELHLVYVKFPIKTLKSATIKVLTEVKHRLSINTVFYDTPERIKIYEENKIQIVKTMNEQISSNVDLSHWLCSNENENMNGNLLDFVFSISDPVDALDLNKASMTVQLNGHYYSSQSLLYYSHIHPRDIGLKSCTKNMYYFSFDNLILDKIKFFKLIFNKVPENSILTLHATIVKHDIPVDNTVLEVADGVFVSGNVDIIENENGVHVYTVQ